MFQLPTTVFQVDTNFIKQFLYESSVNGVCRPCIETELAATEKSKTDQSQLYVDISVLRTAYN